MNPGNQLDGGGLAAAILADEAMNFTGGNVPVDAVQRDDPAEALADVGQF